MREGREGGSYRGCGSLSRKYNLIIGLIRSEELGIIGRIMEFCC